MWDLPGPGLEPASPALAGGFLTTAPPGKPEKISLVSTSVLTAVQLFMVSILLRAKVALQVHREGRLRRYIGGA